MTYHNKEKQEVLQELNVQEATGLSSSEVKKRREQYGENRLRAKKSKSNWERFAEQFKDSVAAAIMIDPINEKYTQTNEYKKSQTITKIRRLIEKIGSKCGFTMLLDKLNLDINLDDYENGLLDQEFITNTTANSRDQWYGGTVGVFNYMAGMWGKQLTERLQLNVPDAKVTAIAPIDGSVLVSDWKIILY